MALVLVLFAIAFISALAVALLEGATTDLAIHRNHVQGLKALYAAHAGVAKAVEQLRTKWDNPNPISGTFTAPDGAVYGYSVVIADAKPVMTVTSTGTAGGYTRKVQARVVASEAKVNDLHQVRLVWWREVFGS